MAANSDRAAELVLAWCTSTLGPCEVVSDSSRSHPGERVTVRRLRTSSGHCYVKTCQDPSVWHSEVHGYERWASAFGDHAPRVLAVRDEVPLALVVTELPGKVLEGARLSPHQQLAVWRAAGQALVALHEHAAGAYFGPCQRDGSPVGAPIHDAQGYIAAYLDEWVERGLRIGCLSEDELDVIRAARELLPAFAGERPVPCHRDYCPANWLVTDDGVWAGVIDFEFAYWDVRAADFTRYPDWEWIHRPELVDAFLDGYSHSFGRAWTAEDDAQRRVGHVQYALSAIVWGMENDYFGFAAEGRQALQELAARSSALGRSRTSASRR